MKIKVNCTKEHLEKAKYCGIPTENSTWNVGKHAGIPNNCWIAVALHDLFPYCSVRWGKSRKDIWKNSMSVCNHTRVETFLDTKYWEVKLPKIAVSNIKLFDDCTNVKFIEERIKAREALEPFSFEIDIPEDILNIILEENEYTLKNVQDILDNSDHLIKIVPGFGQEYIEDKQAYMETHEHLEK
jgi:hypothetical protein